VKREREGKRKIIIKRNEKKSLKISLYVKRAKRKRQAKRK
jgi:hypothetical protein